MQPEKLNIRVCACLYLHGSSTVGCFFFLNYEVCRLLLDKKICTIFEFVFFVYINIFIIAWILQFIIVYFSSALKLKHMMKL